MEAAHATVNVLYAVQSDNLVVSLLLAAVVPFVARWLYKFFHVTWPRFLHGLLIRNVLHREVSAVEQVGGHKDDDLNRLVDNTVMIEMILEYIGHLAKEAAAQTPQTPDGAHAAGDTRYPRTVARAANRDPFTMPSLADLPYAGFRYAPVPVPKAGAFDSHSAKVTNAKPSDDDERDGVGSDGAAETQSMAQYLRDNFQLTVTPTDEVAMEVEPGLFVRYLRTSQPLQQVKQRRQERQEAARSEGKDALAAHSAMEDYLLYDLINKLQESGRRSKKHRQDGRRGSKDDSHSTEGNHTFLQPFQDESEEENDDTPSERSDSDDSHGGAEREQEQAPRQIVLQCRQLRSQTQREAYLRQYVPARDALDDEDASRALQPDNRVEAFAARARAWYSSQVKRPDRTLLFLFYPAASEAASALKLQKRKNGGDFDDEDDEDGEEDWESMSEEEVDDGALCVRRYPIPSGDRGDGTKTFQSLFFAQKTHVMRLLRDFETRSGKFAIPGMPHRLTWLIHGPPGTGKTSLVKAMAKQLRRHVVVLQIGAIRTASTLMEWMQETQVKCDGEKRTECEVESEDSDEEPIERIYVWSKKVTLKPSKVIYLIEDVDAIGSVSGLLKEVEDYAPSSQANSSSMPGAQGHSTNPTDSCRGQGDCRGGSDDAQDEGLDDAFGHDSKNPSRIEGLMRAILQEFQKDQITVDKFIGILNGVAVPDGRIVVMTTNHPERLDPRLLSPSVVTLKISMDDFDAEQAALMIRHYYPEYTAHAALSPATPAAVVRNEEERMTRDVRQRVERALLKHSTRHTADEIRHEQRTAGGVQTSMSASTGRVNPARLEQACAECRSAEELLRTLESGGDRLVADVY